MKYEKPEIAVTSALPVVKGTGKGDDQPADSLQDVTISAYESDE